MKKLSLIVLLMLLAIPVYSQDKGNVGKQDKKDQTEVKGEIRLDALHLDAPVEKPSVSILPKRIKPDLEGVEFVIRDFERELKMLPEELFSVEADRRSFTKIDDIEKLLSRNRN